jgi:hypothetical protein
MLGLMSMMQLRSSRLGQENLRNCSYFVDNYEVYLNINSFIV